MENSAKSQEISTKCSFLYQYTAAFTSALLLLSSGMHCGWSSPSLPILFDKNSSIPITNSQGSWIAVAHPMGSPIGCIIACLLVDKIGRKLSLLIASPLYFLAWISIAYSSSALLIMCGRFLAGISNGITHTIVPIYIGEISNKNIRGLLCSTLEVASKIGLLAINIIGQNCSIKITALIASIAAALHFITFLFAPETPQFLIMKGNVDEASYNFKKLTGVKHIDLEITEMSEAIKLQSNQKKHFLDVFTNRTNRKALGIMIGLIALAHCSGYVCIMFYCNMIFKEADSAVTENTATNIYFLVQLLVTVVCSAIVDCVGRKPLLIMSVIGASLALSSESAYFYLKNKTETDITSLGYLPLIALLVCTVSYSMGIGTIPHIMLSELFPVNIKGLALCIINILFGVLATVVTKLFQIAKDGLGLHVPFFGFAMCCTGALFFIIYCVPETKGKTLEQIQITLSKSNTKTQYDMRLVEPFLGRKQ